MGQLVVTCVNRRITTLVKMLDVVGVNSQRFILSVANQFSMADVLGPGCDAVLEGQRQECRMPADHDVSLPKSEHSFARQDPA